MRTADSSPRALVVDLNDIVGRWPNFAVEFFGTPAGGLVLRGAAAFLTGCPLAAVKATTSASTTMALKAAAIPNRRGEKGKRCYRRDEGFLSLSCGPSSPLSFFLRDSFFGQFTIKEERGEK